MPDDITPNSPPPQMAGPTVPEWVSEYKWPVVGAVAAVAVVVGFVSWTKSGAQHAEMDAAARLQQAQSVNDLSAVFNEFPDTKAAPMAMLRLAKVQFDQGMYDEALKNYDEFLRRYPGHSFAEAGELGRVHCLEATGRVEEALKGFQDFQKGMRFLTPQAVIGQGRCLRALARTNDARIVYEDFITANSKSAWAPRIRELLNEVAPASAVSDEAEPAATPVPAAAATPATDSTETPVKSES